LILRSPSIVLARPFIQENPMSAFGIFIRESTRDQSELDAYTPQAVASMAGYQIKVLAAYGRQQVVEGPEAEGVVIVEFPTLDDALAWYESPAYREARQHRFRGADYRAIFVEGLPP
jgi:uncharacterized protein (DUF1330 family)